MPTLSAVVALCALVFPATTMPITTPACAGREMHYSVNKISGDHSWYIPQAAPPGSARQCRSCIVVKSIGRGKTMPYFVTLHTPAPSYTLSSNERRALFVISAVAFAAIDIITAILGFYTFEMCYLLPNICLWTLFALAGFFRVCEPLFIAS